VAAHQCGLPTPQTTAANNSFCIFTPLSVLVHCIPPLSRFARRAGFVALRQTFVQGCQNRGGGGLQSSGGWQVRLRYGIKAGGTAIVMTTLATGTLPWSDGGSHLKYRANTQVLL
jgi:hypothetical protein